MHWFSTLGTASQLQNSREREAPAMKTQEMISINGDCMLANINANQNSTNQINENKSGTGDAHQDHELQDVRGKDSNAAARNLIINQDQAVGRHSRALEKINQRAQISQADHSLSMLSIINHEQDQASFNHTNTMPHAPSISVMAKALLLTRRRLHIEPAKNLYFLYEPGKQASSAVKIRNSSRSPVAFKFQTNNPKSCFMRPPNGVLGPGEILLTTVVKFIEPPEPHQQKRGQDKFKVVSLKVKQGTPFTSDLFLEKKEFVAVEKVLRVVFLDPCQGPSHEIEKLKKRLAEADADQQVRKTKLLDQANSVDFMKSDYIESTSHVEHKEA